MRLKNFYLILHHVLLYILECDNPNELAATGFTCESSASYGAGCEQTIDGDEATVWTSGLNGPDYDDPGTFRDDKAQWGYNTNVKIILNTETVVSGVQIINKIDESEFYENYKEVRIAFSNGYEELVTLSPDGKANPVINMQQPVETSFVNIIGVSTYGHMPDGHWLSDFHTGFRSGLSEIRIFGCAEGKCSSYVHFEVYNIVYIWKLDYLSI